MDQETESALTRLVKRQTAYIEVILAEKKELVSVAKNLMSVLKWQCPGDNGLSKEAAFEDMAAVIEKYERKRGEGAK